MANPFGTDFMAAGYAASRPAVHPRVMELAWRQLGRIEPFDCALDVGCGAGVSTRALSGFARRRIGLEPALAMLQFAAATAPAAEFVAGTAEALPFRDHAVDLITAAGSLNYVDPDRFFPEAARVLAPGGPLLVYDFSPGRSFRDSAALDLWFDRFHSRYPPPAHEARTLSPEILASLASGFRMHGYRHFEIGITLAPGFYLDYMMTETNVTAAVRGGTPHAEIRSWCAETLAPVWNGLEREVLFRGYFVLLLA